MFLLIKKQFSYYTPEVVADICGCRPADIVKVGELIGRNSGRDRTTAFCYATGFTQHSSGSQIIRTAAILQLLLGNIGRPGGGILALRGHSNVQGATDVPTLFNVLPNYIPQPEAHPGNATLADYLANGHGFSGALDKTSDGSWRPNVVRGHHCRITWSACSKLTMAKTPPKTTNMAINGSRSSVTTNRSPSPWKKPFVAVWMAWW